MIVMVKKIPLRIILIFFLLNYALKPSFLNCAQTQMRQEELDLGLMQACVDLNIIAIENYLTLGANPNYQDRELNTPLHKIIAATSNKIFTLKPLVILLQHGANLNIQDSEGTDILMLVVKNSDWETIKALYEFGNIEPNVMLKIIEYSEQNLDESSTDILRQFTSEYAKTREFKRTYQTQKSYQELSTQVSPHDLPSSNNDSSKFKISLIIFLAAIFILILDEINSDKQIYY